MSLRIIPAVLSTLVLALPARAEPLYDQDNAPVSGIYNLVDSTEGADLLPIGRFAWSLSSITSSHAVSDRSGDEQLVFDGETTRMELRLRYAPTERLEIGLELPYLWHSEGNLDSLIDTWHDIFNLPGGNRVTRATDILEFRYGNAAGNELNLSGSANGIGDLRLTAGWRLGDNPDHARALRFAVTAPTGEAMDLLGSDAVTVGFGYAGDVRNMTAGGKLSLFYRLHATWIDEPAILPEIYNEWIGHAAGGFGYRATRWLDLRAQVLARTATHDADVQSLGESSWILSFGGNIRLGDYYELSLSVGEDIKVESSPDVSFQLSLRYRPGD
jgi:hypothetical protein